MGLVRIEAPSVLPITVERMKARLRVDHAFDDTLIEELIGEATDYCEGPEGFLARALVTQTWELVLDEFPDNEIRIPLPPLQEVVSVTYDDGDGIAQVLDTSEYTVDTSNQESGYGWILPVSSGSWPSTFDGINAVRIRFVAGYPATDDSPPDLRGNIPGSIISAISLLVGSMYEHREDIVVGQAASRIPRNAEDLLRRKRMHLGMA
jgi:uncharacterized phiE125 gp8 family phage protein